MSKKKKTNILYEFDKTLDERYTDLLEEIQFMQADIDRAERKAYKKAKKKLKKGNTFYDPRERIKVRERIIRKMEGNDFFARVMAVITDLRPVVKMIASLAMSLIVSILSIDAVKYRIKPTTLEAMHSVYQLAHGIVMA